MVGHTESGWSTEESFFEYLMFIRQHFNDDPIYLLLDCYAAHRTKKVKELASSLNIELYFIPPGFTDEFQPCDRRIFGSLKANAKAIFNRRYREDPQQRFTKQKACENLVYAWEHLQKETIEAAWEIYIEDSSDSNSLNDTM